ncbi:uncharacterized protein PG986_012410 [Apiospora aurea]|uniref:Uncharacterized protein n=1 Tax=Apiospora aurea TaxID=335848 RepID=A0ABR1Q0I5_9PEZI
MVLHPTTDEEDGGVIEPLLTRAPSSTNATITQPQGATEGYFTMPAPDQKYFHFDGEPQAYTSSRRHSIGGYHHHHHHHHHDFLVAPLRPLMLPDQPRRARHPPIAVDEEAVIRKIDRRLMPLLFLTQMLASADAATLASAVFLGGLSQDAHLQGDDYRALSAWLFLGYLLWAYPTCFFLSTLSTGGPAATKGKRGRSTSNTSSFYTSMYSAGSSESLSLFFLSSASSDSSSIISTSSDSSSFASVYSWDSASPNKNKGNGAGGDGNGNNRNGDLNSGSSDFMGGDFGFSFFVGMLPSWNPWRWIFVLLGAATFAWGFVILFRLLDPISSSSDSSNSAFPGSAAERQWDLDRVAASESISKQLWARSSHVRPRPVPDWKWRQARDCLRDPQTWLIAAMCLLCQVPLASTRGLADLVLLGPGPSSDSGPSDDGSSAPTIMPMSLQITYMLLTIAATIGTGWLASRFWSLTCTLIALAVLPPVIGSACIAKQLHYPSSDSTNNGSGGSSLLDDDPWPPTPTHQILASMLLCTAPAVLPLLLSLIQVNIRGLTKKTTTQALALIAYCLGNLLGPRLFIDDPYDDMFPSPSSSEDERRAAKEASYHTAVHTILVCHGLIVCFALGLRAYLRRRNRAKQDSEMAEVIDAIEYSLYRGAVDSDAYRHEAGDEAGAGFADDFDDMTDWKIPGFQYRI